MQATTEGEVTSNGAAEQTFKYRAFLSYRSSDKRTAERIHRALESYKVPRPLVGTRTRKGLVPSRLGRIFRDRDELRSAEDVESIIAQELSNSSDLIVLCTPASASPQAWVGREIELFRGRRPGAKIHAIIGSGEPPSCFPAQLLRLRHDGSLEQPLAADLRRVGDGFARALNKIVAGLLDLDFDDLWRREQRRRRFRRIVAGSAALVSLLAIAHLSASIVDARRSMELLYHANHPETEDEMRPFLALAALRGEGASPIDFRQSNDLAVGPFIALGNPTRAFGAIGRAHSGGIGIARSSPDGLYIAAAADQDDVRLFRVQGMQLVAAGPRRGSWMSRPSLAFSPTGKQFASSNYNGDRSIRLWNGTTGILSHTLVGHSHNVLNLVYSHDGSRLASASRDRTVIVWNTLNGSKVSRIVVGTGWVRHATFSPKSPVIATAAMHAIDLWEQETGVWLGRLPSKEGVWIRQVEFSPDGANMVALDDEGEGTIWDVSTRQVRSVFRWREREQAVSDTSFSFDPSGVQIIAPCFRSDACVWDLTSGALALRIKAASEGEETTEAVFSSDGTQILTIATDGLARIWASSAGTKKLELRVAEPNTSPRGFFLTGQQRVASFAGSAVHIWDANTGKELSPPDTGIIEAMAVSRDGAVLAAKADNGTTYVWPWSDAKQLAKISCNSDLGSRSVPSAKVASDLACDKAANGEDPVRTTERIASAVASSISGHRSIPVRHAIRRESTGAGDVLAVVDVEKNSQVRLLQGFTRRVQSTSLNPRGTLAAAVTNEPAGYVWDIETGSIVARLLGHRINAYFVEFDSTGEKVLTTSPIGIRVYEARSGRLLRVIRDDYARMARFSADGQRILVAANDGTARIYDLKSGAHLVRFLGGTSAPTQSVAWGPDDSSIAMTSGLSVLVYSLDSLDFSVSRRLEACRLADSGLGAHSPQDLVVPERLRRWQPVDAVDWSPLSARETCACSDVGLLAWQWWQSAPRKLLDYAGRLRDWASAKTDEFGEHELQVFCSRAKVTHESQERPR